MSLGMIGKKVGMTQVYDDDGNVVPITIVAVSSGQILEIKTPPKDGYSALKVGFDEKTKKIKQSEKGYFVAVSKAANKTVTPKRIIKEFRIDDTSAYNIGDVINVDVFKDGEIIDIAGKTKGKGFQGVVKRYNFAGGPSSHGSNFHRRIGAIGAHTFPGRVWKGQKMPGHTGNVNITVKNLKVFKVDSENNLILIQGSAPGPSKGMLVIKKKKK